MSRQNTDNIGRSRDRVDVRFVSNEGLSSFAAPDVPQLCRSITGAGDEGILARCKGQAGDLCIRICGDGGTMAVTYLITSPVWSLNSMTLTPASISHNMQVMSPLLVTIWRSLMKRQQLRYPEWALSSRAPFTRPPSGLRRLYIEQMLSRPPQATKFPDGA